MSARPIAVPVIVLMLLLSGCTGSTATPPPISETPAQRPFTVMTTDRVRVTDPAAVADTGSQLLTQNVFQTLLIAEPGNNTLRPDAADCKFEGLLVYSCTLVEQLQFHNGNPVTSADVKFSVQRAMRLNIAGTAVRELAAVRAIETPDERTVRFRLSRTDNQIGWALAAPTAAIVDSKTYDPDEVRGNDQPAVGSGPFTLKTFSDDEIRLVRFDKYRGARGAGLGEVSLRTMADSAQIEQAMAAKQVEVVWRGLSTAAVTRLNQPVAPSATPNGYQNSVLNGARVRLLAWNPESAHRANTELREVVRVALQEDRTLDSLVPAGVAGYKSSFAMGGGTNPPNISWGNSIALTLGYDPTMPDGLDVANLVRTRLEATGGILVRLRAQPLGEQRPAPDLSLLDRKAWTNSALAWLHPYLANPLDASKAKVAELERNARGAVVDGPELAEFLATLQSRAVNDAVVLPMSQGPETVFFASGVTVSPGSYGPSHQLGFWGLNGG